MRVRCRDFQRGTMSAIGLVLASLLSGCDDDPTRMSIAARQTESILKPIPSRIESCGVGCTLEPGPVPGEATRTLGIGTAGTGVDSVYWPQNFLENTTVKLTVAGVLPRVWAPTVHGYPTLGGTAYGAIDANAVWLSSGCEGDIRTSFRDAQGFPGTIIKACQAGSNSIADAPVSSYSVVGVTKGSGYVRRWSQTQPSWLQAWRCGGQCVFITGGTQTITITPWSTTLTVIASPLDGVVEGDTVTFTAASGTAAVTALVWTWRPDRAPNDSTTLSDPRTSVGLCGSTTKVCKLPLFRSGTMYVSAVANGSRQQASVHVNVDRLTANLSCTPSPVLRGEPSVCTVTVAPTASRSNVSTWRFTPDTNSLPVVEFDDSTFTWEGRIVRGGGVTAVAHLRGRDTVVTSSLSVTARDWVSPLSFTLATLSPSGLSNPPVTQHDLGQTSISVLPWVAGNNASVPFPGPNAGYIYYKEYPWRLEFEVAVNTEALNISSAFALTHPTKRDTIGGVIFCARADLPPLVPMVFSHEGLSRNASDSSHVRVYSDTAEILTQQLAEKWVATVSTGSWSDLRDIIHDRAFAASKRIADTLKVPRHPCRLRGVIY